jgi:hypothetical protein
MKDMKKNCPNCKTQLVWDFDPPYQEYPGAATQDGYHFAECECGWEELVRDIGDFEPRENTRGW